jgi:predicted acyl esterase
MRVVLALLALLVMPASASAAVVKQEFRVPMRDGVELAVDLYLPPEAQDHPVPVILTLTPYHDLYKGLGDAASLDGYRFTSDGYAFAVADVRGTYESGGCWDYGGLHERQDGYDLVEWLGTQAWSNGKVGMIGASYDGTTANAAAVEDPPHLATIVPISSISRWYGYAYDQGARRTYSGDSADIDPPGDTPADFMLAYGFLPPPEPGSLSAATQIAQRWTPCDRADQTAHGYATQPDYDDFWKERDYLQYADRVNVPVLVAHGLQD